MRLNTSIPRFGAQVLNLPTAPKEEHAQPGHEMVSPTGVWTAKLRLEPHEATDLGRILGDKLDLDIRFDSDNLARLPVVFKQQGKNDRYLATDKEIAALERVVDSLNIGSHVKNIWKAAIARDKAVNFDHHDH